MSLKFVYTNFDLADIPDSFIATRIHSLHSAPPSRSVLSPIQKTHHGDMQCVPLNSCSPQSLELEFLWSQLGAYRVCSGR